MTRLSAPIFHFSDSAFLSAIDSHLRATSSGGSYALTGPGVTAETGHLPVRGDLAHIKLAGRYFVPHYAVPMPHAAKAGAVLRRADKASAESVCTLVAGDVFDVLDIAGGWAWGQLGGRFGSEGPVGYVAVDELERIEP